VPPLVSGAGEAAHAATTTSLVVVGTTALVGMVGHLRAGRVHLWVGLGLGFGLVGIGGSFVGSALNREVPGAVLLLLAFSGLILVAAWRMHHHHAETPCHAVQLAVGSGDAGAGGLPVGSPALGPIARPIDHSAPPGVSRGPATGSLGDPLPPAPAAAAGASSPHSRRAMDTVFRVIVAGTAVGFLTGFFGVGGGFVIVPALLLALGYEMPIAVAPRFS